MPLNLLKSTLVTVFSVLRGVMLLMPSPKLNKSSKSKITFYHILRVLLHHILYSQKSDLRYPEAASSVVPSRFGTEPKLCRLSLSRTETLLTGVTVGAARQARLKVKPLQVT